jgi:hypothetical protein
MTNESSPDQIICAVSGMAAYLPFADEADAGFIRDIIPAIARYWKSIDYTIDFSDSVWDVRRDASHMRVFSAINAFAAHIAGSSCGDEFIAEATAIHGRSGALSAESASLFDTSCEAERTLFDDWSEVSEYAGASLLFPPLALSLHCEVGRDSVQKHLAAWRRALAHGMLGFDPGYAGHYYRSEVMRVHGRYHWRPLSGRGPTAEEARQIASGERFALFAYPHRVYWLDATARLPMAYLLYLNHGGSPMPGVEAAARKVMRTLSFEKLHWMADPRHDQRVPEIHCHMSAITSEISCYIAAYWLGVEQGFWA